MVTRGTGTESHFPRYLVYIRNRMRPIPFHQTTVSCSRKFRSPSIIEPSFLARSRYSYPKYVSCPIYGITRTHFPLHVIVGPPRLSQLARHRITVTQKSLTNGVSFKSSTCWLPPHHNAQSVKHQSNKRLYVLVRIHLATATYLNLVSNMICVQSVEHDYWIFSLSLCYFGVRQVVNIPSKLFSGVIHMI